MAFQDWSISIRQITAMAAYIALSTLAGCHSEERFRPEHIAGDSRLVGGGLKIEWQAPEPGTAYLVEERTGKLVQTVTLAAGEVYKFVVESVVEADDLKIMLGIDIDKAQFLLYFKPAGGKTPPVRTDEPAKG